MNLFFFFFFFIRVRVYIQRFYVNSIIRGYLVSTNATVFLSFPIFLSFMMVVLHAEGSSEYDTISIIIGV